MSDLFKAIAGCSASDMVFILGLLLFGYTALRDLSKDRDWWKHRADEKYSHRRQEDTFHDTIIDQLKEISANYAALLERLTTLEGKIQILTESDMEQIKAYFLDAHRRLKRTEYVSTLELQTLDKLYDCYLKENGNSFVKELLEDIHNLPIHD